MPRMHIQYFFDMNTDPGHMQIMNISAGGEMIQRRLQPFFAAYKYFKLGKVKLSMIPASTLPVDPTGLSYELGENTVDPRDQLTPGLVRITNGEDIQLDLSGIDSDTQHKIFNTMMIDRRWFKWSLQRGLKKSAMPLYWEIGNLHQTEYPTMVENLLQIYGTGGRWKATGVDEKAISSLAALTDVISTQRTDPRGIFQTGGKARLGWLPTDGLETVNSNGTIYDVPHIHAVPSVPLFTIILPPAYKTKYYYRVYVTETVYFKEPVVNNFEDYASLDRFIRPSDLKELMPTEFDASSNPVISVPNDGHSDIPHRTPIPGPSPSFPENPTSGDVWEPEDQSWIVNGMDVSATHGNVPPGWIALALDKNARAFKTAFIYLPSTDGAGGYPQFTGDTGPEDYYETGEVPGSSLFTTLENAYETYWASRGYTDLSMVSVRSRTKDTTRPLWATFWVEGEI